MNTAVKESFMSTRPRLISPLFAFSLLLILASSANAQESSLSIGPISGQSNFGTQVELPAPTGPFAVGRIAYNWTDFSRPEPFSLQTGAHREVMVYVWYPADVGRTAQPAPYFPDFPAIEKCAGEADIKSLLGAGYVPVKSGKLRTHSVENAKLSSSSKQYPLLVFSPGFGEYSLTYGAVLEDLASHGYVIAAIDHPYDASCVVFPDGRAIPFAQERWDAAKKQLDSMMAYYGSRINEWAADTRFVLDQLIRYNRTPHLGAPFARHLDLQRIGAFGHSVGGMTTVRACELDTRFRACMNQDSDYDGKPFMPFSSANNIKQPFLFMVSTHSYYKHVPAPTAEQLSAQKLTLDDFNKLIQGYDRNQGEALASMPGGSYRVAVETPDFTHRSFIDATLLKSSDDPSAVARNLQNLRIVRAYTRAFFDKYLKGQKNSLLDQKSRLDPRVRVDRFSLVAR
jgi:predicted dienelactone hydrolase